MMVLRVPSEAGDGPMDITFYDDNPASNLPRAVNVIPANYSSLRKYTITEAQLSKEDWNKANQIRNRWCDQQEREPQVASNEQRITIGIECNGATVVFFIPVTNQSKEIQELTQLIPARTNENTDAIPNIWRFQPKVIQWSFRASQLPLASAAWTRR